MTDEALQHAKCTSSGVVNVINRLVNWSFKPFHDAIRQLTCIYINLHDEIALTFVAHPETNNLMTKRSKEINLYVKEANFKPTRKEKMFLSRYPRFFFRRGCTRRLVRILRFDVYHEARQSSQLCSPDRFRSFW